MAKKPSKVQKDKISESYKDARKDQKPLNVKFAQQVFVDEIKNLDNHYGEVFFNAFIDYFFLRRRKSLREVQDILEKAILIKVLSYVNGNQKDVANFLGIKYTTLNEKIKKYNIKFSKSPIEFNYRGGE